MKSSKLRTTASMLVSFCLLLQGQVAVADTFELSSGTRVYVETTEGLIAKGDQVQQGKTVRAKVWKDVVVKGKVVIEKGTPVVAIVDAVKKRKIAGVKGSMSISALETESVDGKEIQLSSGYKEY